MRSFWVVVPCHHPITFQEQCERERWAKVKAKHEAFLRGPEVAALLEYCHESRTVKEMFEVVLLFEDVNEKEKFMEYVQLNPNDFTKKFKAFEGEYSWIETHNHRKDEQIVSRFKVGKVLNQILSEYRSNH